MQISEKVEKLKRKYDVARTNYAVADKERTNCVKRMKELGVNPKNINKTIKKKQAIADKLEAEINKILDEIDEYIN